MTMKDPPGRPLTSGQLAGLAGVSTDTLRHYERKGVLSKPGRLSNGYRVYPSDSLHRVILIRQALAVGFTLDELAVFLSARDRGKPPCHDVRAMAAKKLEDIDEQISVLKKLRADLGQLIDKWDQLLLATAPSKEARLLDLLSSRSYSANKAPTARLAHSQKTVLRKAHK